VPGHITTQTYNERGQPLSIVYASGVVSSYTYSAQRGWMTGLSLWKPGGTMLSSTYTRDAKGRITGVTSSEAGSSWTYGYDALDQLTQATNTGNAGLSQTFAYDSVGNMLSQTGVGSYAYPAAGQPRPHAPSTVGGQAFTRARDR
jgi:YD repeat-containing protein